jgi:Fe2+ transport system protein FeoA
VGLVVLAAASVTAAVGGILPARIEHAERGAVSERLRRWKDLGLMPGATVTFVRHEPLDGVFEIQVGGRAVTLAVKGVAGLLGELLGAEEGAPTPDADSRW